MSGSVNRVTLIGNLGKDPEIRNFQNGGKMANMTVATSENWTDKASGEKKSRTEWHRISIFQERLVDVVEKYLKKGAKVYIEGQLETRKYTDQSGQEKYSTEIVLRPFKGELVMLSGDRGDPRSEGDRQFGQPHHGHGPDPDWQQDQRTTSRLPNPGQQRAVGGNPPQRDLPLDDDIPF